MSEKQPLDKVEILDQEQKVACVLLLDTSGSMSGEPIRALNEGLQTFKDALMDDTLAKRRVDIAIVTFDDQVKVIQDFVIAEDFNPPTLNANGLTFMGAGINKALDMINERKLQYKNYGVPYYRPWVFMITDGEPQGEPESVIQQASARIKDEEAGNHVAFFAVGVENADMQKLSEISVRVPAKLKGLQFKELFLWLSRSMSAVSHSKLDEKAQLPSTDDWKQV